MKLAIIRIELIILSLLSVVCSGQSNDKNNTWEVPENSEYYENILRLSEDELRKLSDIELTRYANELFEYAQGSAKIQVDSLRLVRSLYLLEIALQKNATNTGALLKKADILLRFNKPQESILCINEIIKIEGTSPELNTHVGMLLDLSGYKDRALVYYEEALHQIEARIKEKNELIDRNKREILLFLLGKKEECVVELQLLEKEYPSPFPELFSEKMNSFSSKDSFIRMVFALDPP